MEYAFSENTDIKDPPWMYELRQSRTVKCVAKLAEKIRL